MQAICILDRNANKAHNGKGGISDNYIAIIGDIKDSKKIKNRSQIQKKLDTALKYVNEAYSADISAKFIITLGDEFQGLLESNKHILDIVKYIQREMYPVRLRFGIGFGEISTNIFPEAAIGAGGPAYYAAREMIEKLREQEKKLKRQSERMCEAYGYNSVNSCAKAGRWKLFNICAGGKNS